MFSPGGSAAVPAIAQVSEFVLPVAASVCEYAVPTVPPGSEVVVIVKPPVTVMTNNLLVLSCVAESVTFTVNEYVPFVVGVPMSCPCVLSVRPGGGSEVPVTTQLKGPVPPVAAKACE